MVVPERSATRWAEWLETAPNRVLKRDALPDGVVVTTMFMGVNLTAAEFPPVLWETMIFGGAHHGHHERYMTRRTALQGHRAAVTLAREALATRTEA